MIDIAHESHAGIVKCKQLLREKVWFPYIDEKVEQTVKKCIPCLSVDPKIPTEPMKLCELPKRVWDEISVNFYGPLPSHNMRKELNTFLLNYRAMPHSSIGVSPAQLIFGRSIKTKIPEFKPVCKDAYVRKRDANLRKKNKVYSDKKRNTRHLHLRVGDSVLLKQRKENKLTAPFNYKPGIIVQKKGSMITVRHQGKLVTRDVSHFKPLGKMRENKSKNHENEQNTRSNDRPRREIRTPIRYRD